MKRVLVLLSLIMFVAISTQAQTQTPSKVGNPEAYLSPEQLAKYQADMKIAELEKKLETYGKWVGVGGEVGTAVKEGLMAVVDVADQFGNTDIGKFTLVMVAWKVMGKDVVRIALGLVFFIVAVFMLFRIHKRSFSVRRICIENPGFFKYPKKYQVIEPDSNWEGFNFVKSILYPFLFAGVIGLTYAIMFGGA